MILEQHKEQTNLHPLHLSHLIALLNKYEEVCHSQHHEGVVREVGVPDLQQKRGDKHSERGGTNTVKGTNTVTQTVTQIAVHKHSEGTNTAKLCERRAV